MSGEYYSVKEFAKIFGLSERSIRKAIQDKRVRAFRVNKSQREPWKIPKSEVLRIETCGICENDQELMEE